MYPSLSYLFLTVTIFPISPVTISALTLNPNPKLVVFSFDGFRYDYLAKANAPTLTRLRSEGVTTPYMVPQFTTKTFPNHQSIVTGLFTEKHGIVENAVFDTALGQEVSGYDDETDFWVYSDEVVPVWLLNELAGNGRVSGAQFPGSTQAYGPNHQRVTHFLEYRNSTMFPYKDRMDTTISWLTNDTAPANLVFMYFDEPDSQGHDFGPNSPEVRAAIEDLDRMTEYFLSELSRLRILDEVNIIILSDHGMEEVKEKNKIKLEDLGIDQSLYTYRGGSPLLQIWPNPGVGTEELYQSFLDSSTTRPFTVYRNGSLPQKWHYNNRRISPILLLAHEGFAFNEVWERNVKVQPEGKAQVEPEVTTGSHGYDIDSPNMRSFFLANGPAFKEGHYLEPFPNVDLFPLMCELVGIRPPVHDGNFSRVRGALRESPKNSSNNLQISAGTTLIFLTTSLYQLLRLVSL